MIDSVFDLPWQQIFPMLGTISLLLFTFGPKLGFVRRFFGEAIQDFVGVTALRADMHNMHEENRKAIDSVNTKVADLANVKEREHEQMKAQLAEHEAILKKLI